MTEIEKLLDPAEHPSPEDQQKLLQAKKDLQNLLDRIAETEKTLQDNQQLIAGITGDTVNSSKEPSIQQAKKDLQNLNAGNLTEDQKQQVQNSVSAADKLLKKLEQVRDTVRKNSDVIKHLDPAAVKSSDKQAILDAMAELQKASENLTEAEKKALEPVLQKGQTLLDTIEQWIEKAQAEEAKIAAYDEKTVTSADRQAIEDSIKEMDRLLQSGRLPAAEEQKLQKAKETAKNLLAAIAKTADQIASASDALKKYEVPTVKSTDKDAVSAALQKVNALLAGKNLTEAERTALEAVKTHGGELLQRISDAYEAVNTTEISNTRSIHKNNVQFSHRSDLEKARDQMNDALTRYADNYTEAEKEAIQKDLARVNGAIAALDRAANVIWLINRLPQSLTAGDHRTMKDIEKAKIFYDNLSLHEQDLVGSQRYEKLSQLYGSFRHYRILPVEQDPDSEDVVFQVSGPFSAFEELRIGDRKLQKNDYTVKAAKDSKGNPVTEITLKDSFLDTLGSQKYTIEVDYSDGIALGSIRNRVVSSTWIPRTGDTFNGILWGSLLAVSALGIAAVIYVEHKKKTK